MYEAKRAMKKVNGGTVWKGKRNAYLFLYYMNY
jgi:hypothetical protein